MSITNAPAMINSQWLEDIYAILISVKNGKRRESQAKQRLKEKHTMFKDAGNVSTIDDESLWQYVYKNKDTLIHHYEHLAI